MEGVHKAHNLAAIARTCDAVGVGWIHAVSGARNLYLGHNAASGTQKWADVRVHDSITGAYTALRAEGFSLLAATVTAAAAEFTTVDYTRPLAIVVGTELDGLSERAIQDADQRLWIPLAGMVESLNVSVATALVLYEAMRQRQAAGFYDQRRIDDDTFVRLAFEWTHPQVADYCNRHSLPYPALDADGNLAQPIGDNANGTVSDFLARIE